MGETKVCTQCNEENMLSEFYIDKRALDEHRSECKVCTRGSRLKYHFGITLNDYNKIKKQQDNKCCICKLLILNSSYRVYILLHQSGEYLNL